MVLNNVTILIFCSKGSIFQIFNSSFSSLQDERKFQKLRSCSTELLLLFFEEHRKREANFRNQRLPLP